MSRFAVGLLRGLVVLAIPIFLLLTSARALISEAYLRYEYGKPDFPLDIYGFTQQQRLDLATVAIQFLWRNETPEQAIQMLEQQRLPGSDQPLYNQYELSHMVDVKRFTTKLWRVYWGSVVVVVGGLIFLLARPSTRREGYNALFGGGVLTAGFLLFLAGFVLLSWRTFFVQFHELFFSPGTWTFDWSDSLIRLFPDMFWFNAGTIITLGALIEGVVVALIGYLLARRTH